MTRARRARWVAAGIRWVLEEDLMPQPMLERYVEYGVPAETACELVRAVADTAGEMLQRLKVQYMLEQVGWADE